MQLQANFSVAVFYGASGTIRFNLSNVFNDSTWFLVAGPSQDPIGTRMAGFCATTIKQHPSGADFAPGTTVNMEFKWVLDPSGADNSGILRMSFPATIGSPSLCTISSTDLIPTNQQPPISLLARFNGYPSTFYWNTEVDAGVDSVTTQSLLVVTANRYTTITATFKPGYVLDTLTLNGTPIPNGYSLYEVGIDYSVVVTTKKLTAAIDLSVIFNAGSCAPGLLATDNFVGDIGTVRFGASGFASALVGQTASATGQADVGSSQMVTASGSSPFMRLVNLVVDGVDVVADPTGGTLTDPFTFTSPNAAQGGVFFTMPDHDISVSAEFSGDAACFAPPIGTGSPTLPPTGGGTGGTGGGTEGGGGDPPPVYTTPIEPPPPPVVPPPPSPPPGTYTPPSGPDQWWLLTLDCMPAGAGTYTGNGWYKDGAEAIFYAQAMPGWKFVKWSGAKITTNIRDTLEMTSDNYLVAAFERDTSFPPQTFTPPSFPIGLDSFNEGQGLIVKWQDDNKNWSKEHYVKQDESKPTKLDRKLNPHGQFVSRRYEVISVDRKETTISRIEQEPEVLE